MENKKKQTVPRLVSYKRKKFQAEKLARSGIEYAQAILSQSSKAKELEIEDLSNELGWWRRTQSDLMGERPTFPTPKEGDNG